MSVLSRTLPQPPDGLSFGRVSLRFSKIVEGNPLRGFVPYYLFRILATAGKQDVGYINFRVGDTAHVRLYAGHIGYEVSEVFRGHRYAYQACRAIAPFVQLFYSSVIITTDPDNLASIRIIERLGAEFINQVPVPEHDPHFLRGSRFKRRYGWNLQFPQN